jgi:hypothetical protein
VSVCVCVCAIVFCVCVPGSVHVCVCLCVCLRIWERVCVCLYVYVGVWVLYCDRCFSGCAELSQDVRTWVGVCYTVTVVFQDARNYNYKVLTL